MDPIASAVLGAAQLSFMPALLASIRTAFDIDLFDLGESVWQLEDVATRKNIDPVLLQRIMRILCSNNIFEQIDRHQYGPSPTSRALAIPPLRDFMIYQYDLFTPIIQRLPEFLRSTSYQNPDGNPQTLTKHVLGHDFWDYLKLYPDQAKLFNSGMSIQDNFPVETRPVYPFMEQARAAVQTNNEQPLLLDIGGGSGHYVNALVAEMPDLSCEIIVQDHEPTTAALKTSSPKIKGMVYDFFEPQPIKGARWYSFRRVFHDWSDTACKKILANTHEAMRKGYSTLLAHEFIFPEKEYTQVEALADLGMSAMGGMERTEKQWRELLEPVGFRIIKIWPSQVGSMCIIEAEAV